MNMVKMKKGEEMAEQSMSTKKREGTRSNGTGVAAAGAAQADEDEEDEDENETAAPPWPCSEEEGPGASSRDGSATAPCVSSSGGGSEEEEEGGSSSLPRLLLCRKPRTRPWIMTAAPSS
ncbi:hypothetical protein AXG93_4188s1090 [Marchantia polymorpha subsp. ruderalis]|uniref:Uncharacterized protein n=1 Tax=Marchantia polymorpha subsp. ruderalis TaxID=1480154 RepID=A0A176WDA7_MARPO|nr:hypothetical protein AXG93_4188s1090 [Marchantia polymorpha subsp. ruderalis]